MARWTRSSPTTTKPSLSCRPTFCAARLSRAGMRPSGSPPAPELRHPRSAEYRVFEFVQQERFPLRPRQQDKCGPEPGGVLSTGDACRSVGTRAAHPGRRVAPLEFPSLMFTTQAGFPAKVSTPRTAAALESPRGKQPELCEGRRGGCPSAARVEG